MAFKQFGQEMLYPAAIFFMFWFIAWEISNVKLWLTFFIIGGIKYIKQFWYFWNNFTIKKSVFYFLNFKTTGAGINITKFYL